MTASPTPPDEQLARRARLVRQLLKLPVHEDSSALARVDLWAIADYCVAYTESAQQQMLRELLEQKSYHRCDSGWFEDVTLDVIQHKLDEISGKGGE